MSRQPRFPAEWEKHRATWIAWPHNEEDWPGNFQPIPSIYVEIVKALSSSEKVEILVHSEELKKQAKALLLDAGVTENYQFHIVPNDRSWLRDSAGTAVIKDKRVHWVSWKFNAWAKYENYHLDKYVAGEIAKISGLEITSARREDTGEGLILEGGAIETDGEGTLLTTEECLLSSVQERNLGISKGLYEEAFKKYLGIEKTLWLPWGYVDDDTHGHIDDVCRFVAPGRVVLAYDEKEGTDNNHRSKENFSYLEKEVDAKGRKLEIIKLPVPDPITYEDELLPLTYANFYIANKLILLPIFNDKNDAKAISIIEKLFPGKKVVGIDSRDLVLGCGAFHCLTQQEPILNS